ncbi:MAG: hypothetical protein ABIJ21_05405 [Nanoarchaeota archaeon]
MKTRKARVNRKTSWKRFEIQVADPENEAPQATPDQKVKKQPVKRNPHKK